MTNIISMLKRGGPGPLGPPLNTLLQYASYDAQNTHPTKTQASLKESAAERYLQADRCMVTAHPVK